MTVLFGIFAAYYAVSVASFWIHLAAFCRRPKPAPAGKMPGNNAAWPRLIAVAPTRAAPQSVRGMVETLRQQEYPADRFRTVILVDRQDDNDPSAEAARAAGAEVYERRDPLIRTKGAAINELLSERLRGELFDALLILDIDARVAPDFLRRVAAHLMRGAHAIQGAPASKNADASGTARLSHAGQALSQMVQAGRSALGLSAILSGTGMIFTRESLERLEWQTSTGSHLSDDGELNLRCLLKGIHVVYGADLELRNDLPVDAQAVRLQRRRWNAAYVELAFPYLGPLMRKALRGHWRVVEGFFNLALLPPSSLAFAAGGLATLILMLTPRRVWGLTVAVLWALHGLYYLVALRRLGCRISARELRQLPAFLGARALGLIEGAILALRADPGRRAMPAVHPGEPA